jgi:hypothetical protein
MKTAAKLLVSGLVSGIVMAMAVASPVRAEDAAAAESWDNLVEVNARRLDAAFLLPGADFRPFTKVMLVEPEVAFRRNWMRDMNRSRSTGRRVNESDVARIKETVSGGTIEVFTRAFTEAGFEVVEAAGDDVLRIDTAVIDLFVNAPDTMAPGRSTVFTTNAGEATLVLEARDSQTNALMARVVDRRETRNFPGRANRVTNTADFRALATEWGRIAASRLNTLKEISPVPDPLTAGQRLP